MGKEENAEKGRALRNTARKERDMNTNVGEQKKDDCIVNRDVESVRLSFVWRFPIFFNAIPSTQANSTTDASRQARLNSDPFCFSHRPQAKYGIRLKVWVLNTLGARLDLSSLTYQLLF